MVHHPLQSENDRCIWTGDGNAQSKLVLSVIFGHYVQKHNIFWRDFRVIISKIMCILTIASCLEGTVWRFHSSDFAMFWNKHSLRVTASHLLSRSHIKGLLLLLVFCWSLTSHFFFSWTGFSAKCPSHLLHHICSSPKSPSHFHLHISSSPKYQLQRVASFRGAKSWTWH